MSYKRWILAGAIAMGYSGEQPARAQEGEIRTLREQIEALDQKLKVLERNRELENESAETKRKETPRLTAGTSGFAFTSADTNFVLKLRGYAQADGRFFLDDDVAVNQTFLMRRVRPILEGTVYQNYDFRLMLDFGTGTTSSGSNNGFLQDGYLNVRYCPEFQVQFGKFKEPVGLERLQSGANLLFIERGLPTQLVPNRDVGVQIHGVLYNSGLQYAVGVFNGVPDGGSGDIDASDDDKDVAARLFTHPFINTSFEPLQGFGFGVAGTYGSREGSLRSYVTPGQQAFFSYRSGDTNVTSDGLHYRIAPQGYYYYGPFGVFGEYVLSSQKLRRSLGSATSFGVFNNQAWQVAASYVLTGEANSFKGITPARPFNLSGGGWGAWEVAARFGELEADPDLFPAFASASTPDKVTSWGVGLNWHVNKNVKFQVNYDRADFRGGSARRGRVTSNNEQAVFTRAQVSF